MTNFTVIKEDLFKVMQHELLDEINPLLRQACAHALIKVEKHENENENEETSDIPED